MDSARARRIIKREYGSSTNMMTPSRLEVGMIGDDRAYELSKGTGMLTGDPIFGVSVVREFPDGSTKRLDHPDSCCFYSLEAAKRHIANLA